jgi:hypothetical protein
MFTTKKKIRLSRGVALPLTKICCNDFSAAIRDRGLKFWTRFWVGLKLCMPPILKFQKFKNLINSYSANTESKFRVGEKCVFECVKKSCTQSFEILKFIEQKF